MKLKVWTEENSKQYEPEQLYVKLETCPNHGDIYLTVVDKEGKELKQGTILTLDLDLKCLIINAHLNEEVPVKTDLDGAILFMTEDEYRERAKENMHNQFMASLIHGMKKPEEQVSKH